MKTYTIVNGPSHGETFKMDSDPAGRDYLYVNRVEPDGFHKYPEDADPQFSSHSMNRKYLLQGEYAYYMGETVFYMNAALPDYPPQESYVSHETQNEEFRNAFPTALYLGGELSPE